MEEGEGEGEWEYQCRAEAEIEEDSRGKTIQQQRHQLQQCGKQGSSERIEDESVRWRERADSGDRDGGAVSSGAESGGVLEESGRGEELHQRSRRGSLGCERLLPGRGSSGGKEQQPMGGRGRGIRPVRSSVFQHIADRSRKYGSAAAVVSAGELARGGRCRVRRTSDVGE